MKRIRLCGTFYFLCTSMPCGLAYQQKKTIIQPGYQLPSAETLKVVFSAIYIRVDVIGAISTG